VSADPTARPTLLLVHGAWHGSWCWQRLVPELTARGWTTATVDMPSATGDENAGMYDDARVIRKELDRIGGPVVLLAHSYGGIPATEAAAGAPTVAHLIYLAAHVIEQGESLISAIGGAWYPPETRLVPPPPDPRIALFADVPEDEGDRAVARLRPQSARAFEEELSQASWKTIPSTYIVCEQDRAMPMDFMEKVAPRANTVHRIPTSHSPFLSRPAELADLIGSVTRTSAQPA
jgi:pimeloyl-ACP methyl ester carboxylesterase